MPIDRTDTSCPALVVNRTFQHLAVWARASGELFLMLIVGTDAC